MHVRSLDNLHLNLTWVTIGMFDGVHRGHRAIIEPMVLRARAVGSPTAVITFHPSPAVVLRGLQDARYLTPPEERATLLTEMGIDTVVTLEFTHALAQLTAEEFIKNIVDQLGLARLWVGYDFALGKNRQGTIQVLKELGDQFGYRLEVVGPVNGGNEVISSTRIRTLLAEGNIRQVTDLLGRWYRLYGQVVHGDGRGRNLGFPTANLAIPADKLLPPNGVYACWIWVDGQCLPAVVNIGVRPTFEQAQPVRRIEAHVLDFKMDFYDQDVRLDFADFIRPEQRFENTAALVAQVQLDVQRARDILVRMDLESGG
ncbi:MAG TPA: bifunctional riboflavin kinase/FAD synthetase [Anaerolineaceae bacterium]|nr:bifunctional riboflavin kinase/FAD synthetase [Anaerolineaceae bacterium]